MVLKNLSVLLLWTKIALAMEGLIKRLVRTLHIMRTMRKCVFPAAEAGVQAAGRTLMPGWSWCPAKRVFCWGSHKGLLPCPAGSPGPLPIFCIDLRFQASLNER